MNIGIIGSGDIGLALAKQFTRAGIGVVLSNRRGPEALAPALQQLGPQARAGSVADAAAQEIVVLSVQWQQIESALAGLPDFGGRILVDATNPILQPGFRIAELGGRPSSSVVASFAPGARVVKAFNTLPPPVLAADPGREGGKRVIFYSGDDAPAKAHIGELIATLGFAGIDLGTLDGGGRLQQFPGGPLPALNLVRLG